MRVFFSQIYIEAGANYPLSAAFQRWLSAAISEGVRGCEVFVEKYAADFDLMFRISAKSSLAATEIHGPTVFRKTRDVEYTIFLPFAGALGIEQSAYIEVVRMVIEAAISVLEEFGCSTDALRQQIPALLQAFLVTPGMIKAPGP